MWLHKFYYNVIYLVLVLQCVSTAEEASPWRWSCQNSKCVKTRNDAKNAEPALCLAACKMFCNEYGLLWPKPTGVMDAGNYLSKININSISVEIAKHGKSDKLMEGAGERFKNIVSLAIPKGVTPKSSGKSLIVYLVNENPDVQDFSLDMDESYALQVTAMSNDKINATISGATFFGVRHGLETLSQVIIYDDIRDHLLVARLLICHLLMSNDKINATISGATFFGVRHGLETLSQVIIYDDIRDHLLMVRDLYITDKPVYPYRGILLDTARNYFDIDPLFATIDAMAAVKLNTFHWHITDSQSFPMESSRRPQLTKHGAYSPSKVYTKEAMKRVVEYGRVRGVRVLPEFDAPAHVGEGWQDTGLTVCFKAEPWASYCVEPPCGQLNPTREELYDVLEDIYSDMAEAFRPDMFHMGGDEVSERCWNSSEEIQTFMVQNRWDLDKPSFLKLWNYFQTKAQDRAYKAFGKRLPLVLWTSTLTDYSHVDKFLNKDEYIIQVWTTGVDPQIKGLLKKGYRLIMSNYDALYLDCGFGAWVGSGNNWCSPYIGWQKVYENSPAVMAQEHKDLVLGGEAALWSEQADSATLDGRLWPRAAAMAERLWAEPSTTWQDAEYRMLHIRERLVRMGINAESVEPEWCYQNEGYCYN